MTIMQATTKQGADVAPQVQVKVPTVTVTTSDGNNQVLQIPTTHQEMMTLLARRGQLSDQLESVTDRRNDIIEQLRTEPDEGKPGLQAQRQALDSRLLQ